MREEEKTRILIMQWRFPMKSAVLAFVVFLGLLSQFAVGIRLVPGRISAVSATVGNGFDLGQFVEAPEYRNGKECTSQTVNRENFVSSCDASLVHVAMTLDSEYLRGSIAAVHSMLRHASCPENVFFHLIAAEFDPASPRVLSQLVRSTFPSLNFKVYIFREDTVINLISSSIRQALENPLNYARNYLGDILDRCVDRVIYLDSDIIVVDDVTKLWNTTLTNSRIIGAPEYCHTNFTKYFTSGFWSDPDLPGFFSGQKPCYFNTGVMVMDLVRWREGNFSRGSRFRKLRHRSQERKHRELMETPNFIFFTRLLQLRRKPHHVVTVAPPETDRNPSTKPN